MNGEKEKKEFLRKKIKSLFNKYTLSSLKEKSKLIQSYFFSLPEYQSAHLLMFYVSTDKEVYTHQMIKEALSQKKKIAVPLISKSQNIMLPCKISDFSDLKPGPFGILQPSKEKIHPAPVCRGGVIIVPGIAFDRKGNRLGRGRGFYDRFLHLANSQTLKIALAFSFQIVEQVPTTRNDVPVDKIITEDEIIECE